MGIAQTHREIYLENTNPPHNKFYLLRLYELTSGDFATYGLYGGIGASGTWTSKYTGPRRGSADMKFDDAQRKELRGGYIVQPVPRQFAASHPPVLGPVTKTPGKLNPTGSIARTRMVGLDELRAALDEPTYAGREVISHPLTVTIRAQITIASPPVFAAPIRYRLWQAGGWHADERFLPDAYRRLQAFSLADTNMPGMLGDWTFDAEIELTPVPGTSIDRSSGLPLPEQPKDAAVHLFDVLRADGADVTHLPLSDRLALLEEASTILAASAMTVPGWSTVAIADASHELARLAEQGQIIVGDLREPYGVDSWMALALPASAL